MRNLTRHRSGEVARRAGVSTDTLAHYERRGVLRKPPRLANGYRSYPADAVDRVVLIKRALAVGFTLDELARLLATGTRGTLHAARCGRSPRGNSATWNGDFSI